MSGQLIFDEDKFSPSSSKNNGHGGITEWIISHSGGLIKNQPQAKVFMLTFVVMSIIFLMFINFTGNSSEVKIEAPPGKKILNEPGVPPRISP